MARPKLWMVGGAALALALAAIVPQAGRQVSAQSQTMPTMLTQMTPSYTVELDVGPAEEMTTLDQASAMGMGEVTVSMPDMGMAMPSGSSGEMMSGSAMMPNEPSMSTDDSSMMPMMATTDNGQPVNHHIEVHVLDNPTSAPDAHVDPQITITDESSGQSRTLDDIAAMYDVRMGMSDLHYGNNAYLPDGSYTFTVTIGQETATFQHVPVANGMGLSMDDMGSMTPAGSMPSGH